MGRGAVWKMGVSEGGEGMAMRGNWGGMGEGMEAEGPFWKSQWGS